MRIEGVVATTASVAPQINHQEGAASARERIQNEAQQQQVTKPSSQLDDSAKATGSQLLQTAVKQAEQLVQTFDRHLNFQIHEETNRLIIRVVNNSTGEVVREIPSEKILDMVAEFQKQLAGLFVDEHK